jgi:fructoselysine-6-P-deglycase FrlB-like protein
MTDPVGLSQMTAEMDRQCDDALATLSETAEAARRVAGSIRATGRVILCAMGGSHHVNRIVAPLYRSLGVDCEAITGSELLLAPPPPFERTLLIASQSGRSGEIVQLLGTDAARGPRYALTLDADSPLAEASDAALVAHGGAERAFAATRSIVLTLAMHGAVLEALGAPLHPLRAVLRDPATPSVGAVAEALAGVDAMIFSAYGGLAGVAESAALSTMELVRLVTVAFEGGQFRHGPFEMLRPGLGVVLFRSAGPDAALIGALSTVAAQAGCVTVLFDTSGAPAPEAVLSIALPEASGLAAATAMLLALQPLNIALARLRVGEGAGTPVRTNKVTV